MPGTLTPIVSEIESAEQGAEPRELTSTPARPWRLDWLLLAIAAVFFVLHYVHLRADFPNNSQWKDWAKYTDEGWYGDAAIRHYQLGRWNVPGDFNPAAALPVWPTLELVLFKFTGVSLVAARALSVSIFGLTLLGMYRLLGMWGGGRRRIGPALAVLLLATSSFCFVFTRLAILEPLLVLLTVMALIAATRAGWAAQAAPGDGWMPGGSTLAWGAGVGSLLALSVLAKTTAVFLLPAVGWTLFAAAGMRWRPFLRAGAAVAVSGAVLWGGYYAAFVRPHFLEDYKYLFSANQYTGFEWSTLGQLLLDTVNDAVWIGRPLFVLALGALALVLFRVFRRGLRENALALTFLLWVLGYGAFLTYHANLQPRYYLVVAVPMTALVAMEFERVVRWFSGYREPAGSPVVEEYGADATQWRGGLAGVVAVLLLISAIGYAAGRAAWHTVDYVLHPEYTWLSAAKQVAGIVDREGKAGHSRLVLSISGSEMALMTGVPAICDDFGTLPLEDRVAKYRPGWFATWNDVEDDKMEALAPLYRLTRVAAIPAFDDPDRNLLLLYRLDPLATPGKATRIRRRRPVWVPRSLRTPIPIPARRESVPVGGADQPERDSH